MDILDVFKKIKLELPNAVKEPFKDHPLADFIRNEATDVIRSHIPEKYSDYICKGSAGMGGWVTEKDAWIAIFNPKITTGASKGYYVVFSFPLESDYVILALGQAHEEASLRYGEDWRESINKIADLRRLDIGNLKANHMFGHEFNKDTRYHYQAGNIIQRAFPIVNIPDWEEKHYSSKARFSEESFVEFINVALDCYDTLYKKIGPELDSNYFSEDDQRHLEIIEKVLQTKADKGPMHYLDITEEAISQKLLTDYKKTPERSFNRTLNQRLKDKFNSHGGGLFSLKESSPVIGDDKLTFRDYSTPTYLTSIEKNKLTKSGAKKRNLSYNSHKEMESDLANLLISAHIEPKQISSGPNVDLCWETKKGFNILEVKSINNKNEDHQLRIGIGQLAEYIKRFEILDKKIDRCFLCLTKEPKRDIWKDVVKKIGAVLITPKNLKDIL